MRCCLEQGEILKLNDKAYRIEETIGEGGSCIVYAACSLNDGRNVRIKELYPVGIEIERDGQVLQWKSEQVRNREEEQFRKTAKKNIMLQNHPAFQNTIVHLIDDVISSNNTCYVVMSVDQGRTFDEVVNDEETSPDLAEVLKILLALANTILSYHKEGYVHLDIKPQNFLVLPEFKDRVKIIDIDSVEPLQDVQNRKAVIRFTNGWAAPELKSKNYKAIGGYTDIYSIGAILFSWIMGRVPDVKDNPNFPNWNVREALKEKITDFDVINSLDSFLKKCLCKSPRERYQSMEEVISKLEELCQKCGRKRFIKSEYSLLARQTSFVGREKELQEIAETLKDKKAVFLYGFRGIGKTSIAQKYIELNKKDYEIIVFFKYQDSLDDFINGVKIINEEGKEEAFEGGLREKLECMKQIVNEKVLFVIDNFDTKYDHRLLDVLAINAKFLFTTRINTPHTAMDSVVYQHVTELSREEGLRLFELESGIPGNKKNEYYMDEILKIFDYHSFLISLVARYTLNSNKTISKVYEEMIEKGISGFGKDSDYVEHEKDGVYKEESILGHIEQLIGIMGLKEDESKLRVLDNIYFLSKTVSNVTEDCYRRYTGAENLNALKEMVKLGLVKKSEAGFLDIEDGTWGIKSVNSNVYSLHSLIAKTYETLDRKKEEIDLYYCSRKLILDMSYRKADYFPDYCSPEISVFISLMEVFPMGMEDAEVLVQLFINFYLKRKKNPFNSLLENVRSKKILEHMLEYCRKKGSIYYGNQVIPWWFSLVILSGSMYIKKMRDAVTVMNGIRIANQGIAEVLSGRKTVSENIKALVDDIIKYEMTILVVDIFYSGKTIYNYQRALFQECGHLHKENCGVCINLRKNLKVQNVRLFEVTLHMCEVLEKRFGYENLSEEIISWKKAIIWNLNYLNGMVGDPFEEMEYIRGKEETLLYFSHREEWKKRKEKSLIELIQTCSHRMWIYKLVLDDVFLLEQPKSVVRKLCEISVFDMIAKDRKLSGSEKEYLLLECVVENSNRFLAMKKKSYKGKRTFEQYYDHMISYYGQNDCYLKQSIAQEKEFTTEKSHRIWNRIVLNSLMKNTDEIERCIPVYFSKKDKNLEQQVLFVCNLKRYGYKEEANRIVEHLVAEYTVDETNRNWKVQIRNAIALSRIVSYHGKNSPKKQLIRFVESNLTLEKGYEFIKSNKNTIFISENVGNVLLGKLNDELAQYWFEHPEEESIQDEILLANLKWAKKIVKIHEILELPEGLQHWLIPEEIYMMEKYLSRYDSLKVDLYHGREMEIVERWYRKRLRYDEDKNYIGQKYILYIAKVVSQWDANYFLDTCEKERLVPVQEKEYETLVGMIEKYGFVFEGGCFMDIPSGIDEELPFW